MCLCVIMDVALPEQPPTDQRKNRLFSRGHLCQIIDRSFSETMALMRSMRISLLFSELPMSRVLSRYRVQYKVKRYGVVPFSVTEIVRKKYSIHEA